MRKKLFGILVGVLMLLPMISFAKQGCGVGPTVVNKQNSLFSNLVATFTDNYSSSTNTFAITSGTLGCSSSGLVFEPKVLQFVKLSYTSLQEDLVKQEGPFLDKLAADFGCSDNVKIKLAKSIENKFNQMKVTDDTYLYEIDQSMVEIMRGVQSEPELKNSCHKIS